MTSQLYATMITQGGNKASILRLIKKAFQRYPETFPYYCKTYDELVNEIIENHNYSRLLAKLYICKYVSVGEYVYIYIYICALVERLVIKCHSHQQNKQGNTQSDGLWNLINSAGESEKK